MVHAQKLNADVDDDDDDDFVEEEDLDPRVQEELERLNSCTDEINQVNRLGRKHRNLRTRRRMFSQKWTISLVKQDK
jgi:hypothetical protein